MKIVMTLLCLICLLGVASGQGTDVLGLYDKADITGVNHMTAQPNQVYKLYLNVLNGSDPAGVAAWECNIEYPMDGSFIPLGWDLTWGAGATHAPLNIDSPPGFIVGLGTYNPIAYSNCMNLLTITFMVTDDKTKVLQVIPNKKKPSIPGYAVYVGASNVGKLIPFEWAAETEAMPSFLINGETLESDVKQISASTGGAANLSLYAGNYNANRTYLILANMTGGNPGTPLPGGQVTLPLNWDLMTNIALDYLNTSYFAKFYGNLDNFGNASATFSIPPGVAPSGMSFNFSYAIKAPWNFVSNSLTITITP